MKISPESLARASSRHPWRTVAVWGLFLVASGVLVSVGLDDVLTNDIAFTNRPESIQAQDVMDAQFGGKAQENAEFVIVQSPDVTVTDPSFQGYVQKLQGVLAGAEDIVAKPPVTYYDVLAQSPQDAAGLVSQDQHATLMQVQMVDKEEATADGLRDLVNANADQAFTTQVAGTASLNADFARVAQEDARKGEGIGFGVAFIVLIIVFAAIVAALVPLTMAIFAIFVALGLVTLIGQLVNFQLFVTNMISMIGLAVGIDYSLFIVSRFREERKKGFPKLDAIGAAGATANRAVFFSGMTVVLALLGMFIIPTTIFRSLAAGAMFVTLAAIAASMTLLPAVLSLLGDRINWPRLSKRARLDTPHDVPGGVWDRLARRVMARPWVFLVSGVVLLGFLGSFYLQLNKGSSTDIEQLPDVPSKEAFLTLQREFSGGRADPVQIIVTGDVQSPQAQSAIEALQGEIAANDVFSDQTVVTPSQDGSAVQVSAYLQGTTSSDTALGAIRSLRDQAVPAAFGGVPGVNVDVGGNTAIFTDFLSQTDSYQWIVLAFVLGLSFILLTIVFRSIIVPIKAILMNLLSVAAAYGAITLVFQKGVGIGFFNAIGFDFHQSPAIEAWLPLFLFSVLFGLSMDYEVFLLTRIREEYDKTHDNTEAVAYGLRTTAGIITGAAIIMVVVFTAFALGRLGPLQQMGFGLAIAVLMDASIVRVLLVPSTMRLLGDWNWYLPRWLQWLPQLHVEGREPHVVHVPEPPREVVPVPRGVSEDRSE
jgi:RND superfamily putative drug exporter